MHKQQIIEMARRVGLCRTMSNFDDWIDGGPAGQDIVAFAKLVAKSKAEELATELEKGPLNDTATSIAIWIRSQE
jgi:hypothetical protein